MKELKQTVVVRDVEFTVSYSYEPEPPNSRYFPDEDYGLTIHSINVGCDDMLGLLSDEVLEEIEAVVREEHDVTYKIAARYFEDEFLTERERGE